MVKASSLKVGEIGYKPLHLSSGSSLKRFKKKTMARQNWFKENSNNDREEEFHGVKRKSLKAKPTPKVKEREDEMANITGFRIKYQEAGSTQSARMFSTDLARDLPCGRSECWPCNSTQEGKIKNCRARSVL